LETSKLSGGHDDLAGVAADKIEAECGGAATDLAEVAFTLLGVVAVGTRIAIHEVAARTR
jgi:hypothetical protein